MTSTSCHVKMNMDINFWARHKFDITYVCAFACACVCVREGESEKKILHYIQGIYVR